MPEKPSPELRKMNLQSSGIYRWLFMLFTAAIFASLFCLSARAQGTVTMMKKGRKLLKTTTEITCVRHSTRRSEPEITVPMKLEIGDELRSSGGVTVTASCGKQANLLLQGPFRVRFLRVDNDRCNLYYYSIPDTQLTMTSSSPTSVRTDRRGHTRLYSPSTQYEIKTIRSTRGEVIRHWIVYEGNVELQTPQFSKRINQSEKLVTKGAVQVSSEKTTRQDFEQAAESYATIDVSRTSISDGDQVDRTISKLKALHLEVLIDPSNQKSHVDLANEQRRLGIPTIPQSQREWYNPWIITLVRNTISPARFRIINPCKETRIIRIEIRNLPFLKFSLDENEINLAPGYLIVRVEFDTTGIAPGEYHGEIASPCLNCRDKCFEPNEPLTVNVTVIEKTPEPAKKP